MTRAKSPGRPPYHKGGKMTQTAIWLPAEMLEWLRAQPDSMSETVRRLIKQVMDRPR